MRRFGMGAGLLLLVLSAAAYAQKKGDKKGADKPIDDPAKQCEQMLARVQKGDKQASETFEGQFLDKAIADQLNKELPGLIKNAASDGKAMGVELAAQQTFGEAFLKLTYLAKYERGAISWTFLFYKPQDKWFVYSVTFTGDIAALLQ
ncbi:MAG: hypothetical protein ACKV0T_18845 [Planctomycetales bacterium]